ncbi:MAG: Hsp70 family protein [Desulfobacterales bacterium]
MKKIFGKEPNKGVNPDEVVALGPRFRARCSKATQGRAAARCNAAVSGYETMGGVMTKPIGKNTTVPVRKSEIFSTAEDNQPAVVRACHPG